MYEYRGGEKSTKFPRKYFAGMGVFTLAAVTLLIVLVGVGALVAFHNVFGVTWRTDLGGPLLQTFADWASTFGFRHLGLGGVISVMATQSWICLASLYYLFDRASFTQTFPFWYRQPAPVAALFPAGLFSRMQYACNFAFWCVLGLEAVRSWLLRLIAPPDGARLYWWHKDLSRAVNVFFWFILLPLRGLEQLLKIPASILACIGYIAVKAVSCCRHFASRESVLLYADNGSQSESVVESTSESDPIDPQESIYYVRPDDELLSPISTEWKSACQRTEIGTFKPMLMHAQLKSPTNPGGFDYCANVRESVAKKVMQLTVYIDGKACICEMRGLPEMDDSKARGWLLKYIEAEEWVSQQRRDQESAKVRQVLEDTKRLQEIGEAALQAEQRRFAQELAALKRRVDQNGAKLDQNGAKFEAEFAEAQAQVKQNAADLAAIRKTLEAYQKNQEAVGAPQGAHSIPSPRRRGPGFAFDAHPPSVDSAAAAVIIDGESLQK